MSLEHLIAALEKDAAEEARAELERAHAEAARIARETDEQHSHLRADYHRSREAELRTGMERALAQARREGRQEVLKARGRFLETVLARASRRLSEAEQDEDFLDSLPVRLERAASYLGGRPGIVLCPPSLAKYVEHLLAGREGLRVQPDSSLGPGVRLQAEDGSVEIDETLEGALHRLRPYLCLELVAHMREPASEPTRVAETT